jgi:hypothetical protein
MESQARLAYLQGDGLEFTQKNQKADPQAAQSTADCANGSQLDMGTRFYVRTLHYGRPFRTLNVIDESNREILAIEIDISLPAARVVRTLEQLEEIHGLPKAIRLDNGSELRSATFMGWSEEKALSRSLSDRASLNKMLLLNALIKPTVTRYLMPTYLRIYGKYERLPKNGSPVITKKGRIAR